MTSKTLPISPWLFLSLVLLSASSLPANCRDMSVDMSVASARKNAQFGNYESVLFKTTRAVNGATGREKAILLTTRGSLRMDHEQYKDALVDLNEAIKLAPDMARAYNKKAEVLCALNQMEPAITAICQYIKLDPKSNSARYFRGKMYLITHQLDKAAADFTYCTKHGIEETAPSHRYLGKVLVEKKKYAEAIEEFTLGMKAGNTTHIHATLLDRSKAYDLLGKHDLAESDRKQLRSGSTDMYSEFMR